MARCLSAILTVAVAVSVSGGCASSARVEGAAPVVAGAAPVVTTPARGADETRAVSAKPATRRKPAARTKVAAARSAAQSAPRVVFDAAPTGGETSAKSGTLLTLGAGDQLGKAVYINDVILAARAARRETEFAEVQPKADDR